MLPAVAHTTTKMPFTAPYQQASPQPNPQAFTMPQPSPQLQQWLYQLIAQLIQQLQHYQNQLQQPDTPSTIKPIDEHPSTNPWQTDRGDIMLFGDPATNRIVPMKLSTFEQLPDIPIDAEKVYSADHITDDKAYVMNRGSNFMTVLERNTNGEFKETDTVSLPFHPRTGAKNTQLGLELVTGVDKPMFALVDYNQDTLVASGGRDIITQGTIGNYDGENATGHGTWVSDDQFILPDRANSTLYLYQVTPYEDEHGHHEWSVKLQDSAQLPSSTHTVHGGGEPGVFYAALEGNPATNTPSGLAEITVDDDELQVSRIANMLMTGNDDQGTHHPDFHPDGQHIYVGDNSGFVHVVDKDTMRIETSIPAGKGAGHVTFVPERNIAIVTNHHDSFVTIIDMENHTWLKNIEVATDSPAYDEALQAHTARLSPDHRYYYNFASDSGTFFRIDLESLEKDGEIYTGGTPKQASQPGQLTLGYNGATGTTTEHQH